jgi:CheY-like chemotaxis protein
VAQSIGEALDLLSRFKPDVALLSDTVPGAVAGEFLKQLPLPPARIIVMANGAITDVRSQLIGSGIVLVFDKPINPAEIQIILQHLGDSSSI